MGFNFYAWVIVPLLIFCARIVDVSLGTLRVIYLSKGYKKVAPLLGFLEIVIWLLAIRGVLVNLQNVACFWAYAAGFAMGNYVGIWLEEKLSVGMVFLRIVFSKDAAAFIQFLQEKDYGYTVVEGQGAKEKVKVLFSAVKRKSLKNILAVLESTNPNAFYTVENVKSVHEGTGPNFNKHPFYTLFRKYRKGK